jgi:hypothetical protein
MTFELHKVVRPKDLPATVRIRGRKAGWVCFLSIRSDLLKEIGGTEKNSFDVLIGLDADKGKLRLGMNNKDGIRCRKIRGDTLTFDLGHVPDFAQCEVDKQRCDGRKVGDQIEIDLPDWDMLAIEADDDPRAREPAPRAPAARDSPPAKTVAAGGANPSYSAHGVTVDLRHGEESVSYKNKMMDISTRQAALTVALLRGAPSAIGCEFLRDKILTDVASHMRETTLDMACAELKKALAGVGLDLKTVRGVGYSIAVGK